MATTYDECVLPKEFRSGLLAELVGFGIQVGQKGLPSSKSVQRMLEGF